MLKDENILEIISPIKDEFAEFENKLLEICNCKFKYFQSDILSFLFNNSKRLRPIFTLLFSKLLGVRDLEKVLNICLALEIVHNASLVHDDILDCEKIRKNKETIVQKFNPKTAVLIGDYLLSCALEILSKTELSIVELFSCKIKSTIEAEFMQNEFANKILKIDDYLLKTFNKTGNLFLCGIEALFEVLENNINKENTLLFIRNYALAFQIKNDIDNIKKNKMSDFTNGNYTLPVLYYLEKNSLNDLYLAQNKLELLQDYILNAQDVVFEYKSKALKYLNCFEENQYKTSIVKLVNYTLGS